MSDTSPWFVHLYMRGTYCGVYQFNSEQSARKHADDKKNLNSIGCFYRVDQHPPLNKRMITIMELEWPSDIKAF